MRVFCPALFSLALVAAGPVAAAESQPAERVLTLHAVDGEAMPNRLPSDDQWLMNDDYDRALLVRRQPLVAGDQVTRLCHEAGQLSWDVRFNLGPEGARALALYSTQHLGERVAMVLDGERLLSAPVIMSPLNSDGEAVVAGVRDRALVEALAPQPCR